MALKYSVNSKVVISKNIRQIRSKMFGIPFDRFDFSKIDSDTYLTVESNAGFHGDIQLYRLSGANVIDSGTGKEVPISELLIPETAIERITHIKVSVDWLGDRTKENLIKYNETVIKLQTEQSTVVWLALVTEKARLLGEMDIIKGIFDQNLLGVVFFCIFVT